MKHLYIDIETYSSVSLPDCGVNRYVESPDFEILLFAYSADGADPVVIDLACGEQLPRDLLAALSDARVIKHAHNAVFEWTCLRRRYGELPIEQWRDTMLHAAYCGYPASLEAAGAALGLGADAQKLACGKALVKYFCTPCAPTKANGNRTRNLPKHDPDKWALFKEYNARDVTAEMAIDAALAAFPVPESVQGQWEQDALINARGVAVDLDFVDGALDIGSRTTAALQAEARALTGLENPGSVQQLKAWLSDRIPGGLTGSLDKGATAELLSRTTDPVVRRVLELRRELGKTSITKYDAIARCVCSDGRVRGLLRFYGANRTGRWAGRLVQVQNLPRTYTEPLDPAREMVKARNAEGLAAVYGGVQDTLSQLIRTALTATPGGVLIDADFSAIEARVISWLAGEKWKLDVFRSHGRIYEASASQMFGVPIERIVKGNPEYALRQRGKVAELALGYQGGVSAMRAMDVGHQLDSLDDVAVQDIVNRWRATNCGIVRMWRAYEVAAKQVIANGGVRRVPVLGTPEPGAVSVVFRRESDSGHRFLTVELPSGRKLFYVNPRIGKNRFGNDSIIYDGVNQQTRQYVGLETYGGKLTENVVQAVARDCLAVSISRLEYCGYPVVFHVHDEVIVDYTGAPADDLVDRVSALMTADISWAPGLPLNADGWTGPYYRKE